MPLYSARRKMIWEKLQKPKVFVAFLIATASGSGLFPVAPGTAGTVAALPVVFLTNGWPWQQRVLFWVVLTGIGTWAARIFDDAMETHDNQNIVIDEVIGFGISAWTVGGNPWTWLVAFCCFRILDGLKPPPIRQIDSWSRFRASPQWSGFGVIADDIGAGLQTLAIVVFLQWLRILN